MCQRPLQRLMSVVKVGFEWEASKINILAKVMVTVVDS